MTIHLITTMSALAALAGTPEPALRVQVDTPRQQVVLEAGPLTIPASTAYTQHAGDQYFALRWPASGWIRGYRIELLDSTGAVLPATMVHHAGMANLDRRQIAYAQVERVFAAAQETGQVDLPRSMGLPLQADQRMVLYFALVNPAAEPVTGASLRVTLQWTPDDRRITDVLPFYANAKPDLSESISFDIPPGRSSVSAEFSIPASGYLRALGGHLHDHAVELRLEDVATGRVLVRLGARTDAAGRLSHVERTVFPLRRHGLRLEANRRYRVVAAYHNPTCETIAGGAMGFLAGVFLPDDARAWPAPDYSDDALRRDVAVLTGATPAVHGGHHHGHEHDSSYGC